MVEDILANNIRVIGFCPNCGKAIPERKGRGRRRIFCSQKCRSKYARQHASPLVWETTAFRTCEYCGGPYMVFQKTSKPRRFCSVSCARRYAIAQKKAGNTATPTPPVEGSAAGNGVEI